MSTVRFTAEILPDGTIQPPKGLNLAPGPAEVTVESENLATPSESLRDFIGIFRSGDPCSADNDKIDADLSPTIDDLPPKSN